MPTFSISASILHKIHARLKFSGTDQQYFTQFFQEKPKMKHIGTKKNQSGNTEFSIEENTDF